MEVQGTKEALNAVTMEEAEKAEGHMISAAAFVEGGIQDACDDACSICLEEFCESEPSTLTSCKHEFHLQCILEWCQRSSQCPMCWQPITLKDPTSQELLEAVEQERSFRLTPSRNSTIFHHPTLGDFELQHVPMSANDPQLEARIIQHLTAAAAMGRARHFSRREGQRSRPSAHGRPQYLVFSSHPNNPTTGPASASITQIGGETEPAPITLASPSTPLTSIGNEESHHIPQPIFPSGSAAIPINHQGSPLRVSSSTSSSPSRDRAGPSDFQSFSESLKSRFSSLSVRYKESISKGTKGWKERFFSRGSSGIDHGSEDRRDLNTEFDTSLRIVECSETRDDSTTNHASISGQLDDDSDTEQSSRDGQNHGETPLRDREIPSSCLDGSSST